MTQTKQPLTQQEIQQVSDILTRQTARAMVIDRYGSTLEEAKKWGYVENTWLDKQFQDAALEAFIEEAMKGDPWEGHNGNDSF